MLLLFGKTLYTLCEGVKCSSKIAITVSKSASELGFLQGVFASTFLKRARVSHLRSDRKLSLVSS